MKKRNLMFLLVWGILFLLSGCSNTLNQLSPDLDDLAQVQSNLARFAFNGISDDITLEITFPNYNKTIAEFRDFYVIGNITGEIPNGAIFSVSLYRNSDSARVRHVFTGEKANKAGLYVDYPLLTYTGINDPALLYDSMMPDLVYDPSDANTFQDQWRKCYFDDYNFTTVFHGGEYTIDVNPYDENDNLYTPLASGEYTIVASLDMDTGENLGIASMIVTIGVNTDKAMTRFTPSDHGLKAITDALSKDYAVYIDPFPGLFNYEIGLVNFPVGLDLRINRKWRYMDILEYREGKVYFYIYNVTPSSTTWSVETGTIMETQDIEDQNRLECIYYDIGDLQVGLTESEFVVFAATDNLQLTRADFPSGTTADNYLVMSDLDDMQSDFDYTDGISGRQGEIVSFYGAVKPIQNTVNEIYFDEDNSVFQIENKIAAVQYNITGTGVSYSVTKDVGLTRLFDDGTEGTSLLEFKHDFELLGDWVDKSLTVSLSAYDILIFTKHTTRDIIEK
ncbi:MAG: hypothetical protein LBF60_05260 [Treponema sp.]|nr:hypothetical protein [Treponema sp.]